MAITSALKWPSPTLQWLPERFSAPSSKNGDNYTSFLLLSGTNTSARSTEYLNFLSVDIPTKPFTEQSQAASAPKVKVISQIPHRQLNKEQDFPLAGEVNIARYNPFDASVISSFTNSGDVYLYKTEIPNLKDLESTSSALQRTQTSLYKYHTRGGTALSWNTKINGLLATGSDDSSIAIWDVASNTETPKYTLDNAHTAAVTGIDWSPFIPTALASVSADGSIVISDTRSTNFSTPVIRIDKAHQHLETEPSEKETETTVKNGDKNVKEVVIADSESKESEEPEFFAINDISFSPFNQYLYATASSDNTAAIWDLRRTDKSIHTLNGHSAAVTKVKWSPHHDCVLATAGYDRRVMVWDLSRIESDEVDEYDDGPNELLFVHGGHTTNIADFDWHPSLPWVIASSGEDNIVQIWKPSQENVTITEEQDEDEEMRSESEPEK